MRGGGIRWLPSKVKFQQSIFCINNTACQDELQTNKHTDMIKIKSIKTVSGEYT